jgi:superfamily II DNA helicase RecQ
VSLLCVDEAHCLSQWSYNFRPAFLRIRREIQFIQPAAVLALTATATPRIQVRTCFCVVICQCVILLDRCFRSWINPFMQTITFDLFFH